MIADCFAENYRDPKCLGLDPHGVSANVSGKIAMSIRFEHHELARFVYVAVGGMSKESCQTNDFLARSACNHRVLVVAGVSPDDLFRAIDMFDGKGITVGLKISKPPPRVSSGRKSPIVTS